MRRFQETEISMAIIETYQKKLSDRLVNDVIIAGAGPAGMVAAADLANQGYKVTILEKRLAPGGGIWGGGMAMNEAVAQDDVLPLLDEVGIRHQSFKDGLHTIDSLELASGLCLKAIQAGAVVFNLTVVEDICLQQHRVTGVVANRSFVYESVPVDPIMLFAKAVIDGTGHEAFAVNSLRKRGILEEKSLTGMHGEGLMDANAGEEFVVKNTSQIYPGLWVSGMSVCASLGGPRMGPIFGGMLMSGRRVAKLIDEELKKG
jgi:sulfide-dependent adenosine diphosphate thiazole synthase